MTKKIYPSAVDVWFLVILIGVPSLLIGLGVSNWEKSRDKASLLLIGAAMNTGLMVALTVPCRYTLTTDDLQIRCGLMETIIPLAKITGAELSSSVLSAPALSLRRVKVFHADGYALISPRGREEFIADLLAAVERRKRVA